MLNKSFILQVARNVPMPETGIYGVIQGIICGIPHVFVVFQPHYQEKKSTFFLSRLYKNDRNNWQTFQNKSISFIKYK